MSRAYTRMSLTVAVVVLCLAGAARAADGAARAADAPRAAGAGQYKNFAVAVYVPVGSTRNLADPQRLAREWERISGQVKVDKVYLETYRDRQWADEATLDPIKKFFTDKGIRVAGGITLAAGGQGGQFGTFDYEDPKDREECRKAVELTARHFDEIILDDFFFYATKSDADIAAKGKRSWTQYRLEKMREVAKELVMAPARAANPRAKVIIKYPNWYEHFAALGFDLEKEPEIFDGIYTGTETRDPWNTDQHLQPYLSYSVVRYFNNIAKGVKDRRNGGGWVDTFSIEYVDRYAEQLWDTAFAKPAEITLFEWSALAGRPPRPGNRAAWEKLGTSLDYDAVVKSHKGPGEMTWARVAGYSLEQVDAFLGKLGEPVGLRSYRPYHATGEDFLHTYLGMIGIPVEMEPTFPADAKIMLLTEAAKFDPNLVDKIKKQLVDGKDVVITSGLLEALGDKGIDDIVELRVTGRKVLVKDFLGGYGAGTGTVLSVPDQPPVLIPEIRFATNDAWQLVSAVAADTGFPILLMDRYSKGILYVLTIPENPGDLYNLPQGAISSIKRHLLRDFPVWTDSPAKVSLFAYDNRTFIVQSFLPAEAKVTVLLPEGAKRIRNLVTDQTIDPAAAATSRSTTRRRSEQGPARANFTLTVKPHSFEAYAVEE